MLEPLRAIPGPEFLLYYAAGAVVVFVFVRTWAYDDGSMDHMPPQMTRVDPYAVAALRGGAAEAAKVALYDLERQGAISLSGSGEDVQIKQASKPRDSIHPTAQAVYDYTASHGSPRDIFADQAFLKRIERGLKSTYADLKRKHVMRDEEQHSRAWKAFGVGMALLWAVGGAKLYMGLWLNKPVLFLVMELIAVPFLLGWAARPANAQTALGRGYISGLKDHFQWVKDSAKRNRDVDDINMAFAVALFGGDIFAEGIMYDLYNKAAQPRHNHSGGCSGGGCSGGGGCGGGGCGGCG